MTAEAIVAEVKREMGNSLIPAIYQKQILPLRTRQYELRAEEKLQPVEVLHTLLGIEVKIGKRRLLCPDLATARYLAVFARIGCDAIAVPYDITQISRLADELESSWHRMNLLAEHLSAERSPRFTARVKQLLAADLRAEIKQLGAGTKIPQFNQKTKQRR
jgi:hypothetical protein